MKMTIHGVPGTLSVEANGTYYRNGRGPGIENAAGTFHQQVWKSDPIKFKGPNAEKGELIVCEIRFDDECRNGHNSFAITGHTYVPGRRDWETCGCIHDSIAEAFPALAHLTKWHLFDVRGPMHYVANTVYHASNLHNGKAKGEPSHWDTQIKFGSFPITFSKSAKFTGWLSAVMDHRAATPKGANNRRELEITEVPHTKSEGHQYAPHYSFDDFTDVWHEAPFRTKDEALEWQTAILTCGVEFVKVVTGYSPGKERNFAAARSCAVWPEATDEQLSLPAAELTKLLEERRDGPEGLVETFRKELEATGLKWEP